MDELASTYVVQDRNSKEELNRLIIQDQMFTTAMGGILPEQEDPARFRRVLDIGCGPGRWLLDIAQEYPTVEKLYGIDISKTIVNYACQQAKQRQVPTGPRERVEFLAMDALRMLEFPDSFIDLVNFRFGVSFMRQWDWKNLYREIRRVLRTDGTVRIVETLVGYETTSTAFLAFLVELRRAFYRAGHLFEENERGLINKLPDLLIQHGFQKIESRQRVITFKSGTQTGDAFVEDMLHLMNTIRPFLQHWGCLPQNYDEMCQQALREMKQPDFVASTTIYTIWAGHSS